MVATSQRNTSASRACSRRTRQARAITNLVGCGSNARALAPQPANQARRAPCGAVLARGSRRQIRAGAKKARKGPRLAPSGVPCYFAPVAAPPSAGGSRYAGRVVDPDVRDDGETEPEVELNPGPPPAAALSSGNEAASADAPAPSAANRSSLSTWRGGSWSRGSAALASQSARG